MCQDVEKEIMAILKKEDYIAVEVKNDDDFNQNVEKFEFELFDYFRSNKITGIMMKQLKNQFMEFVSFVNKTNSVFVEQIRNTQNSYDQNIRESQNDLKERVHEQKETIREKDSELKACSTNKEKLLLGYQECALKYQYARESYEQTFLQTSSNTVGSITAPVHTNIKELLSPLTQDVTPEKIETIKK